MKLLLANVPCLAFLGTGVYLLFNGHELAGGFLVFMAVCAGRTYQNV